MMGQIEHAVGNVFLSDFEKYLLKLLVQDIVLSA